MYNRYFYNKDVIIKYVIIKDVIQDNEMEVR